MFHLNKKMSDTSYQEISLADYVTGGGDIQQLQEKIHHQLGIEGFYPLFSCQGGHDKRLYGGMIYYKLTSADSFVVGIYSKDPRDIIITSTDFEITDDIVNQVRTGLGLDN